MRVRIENGPPLVSSQEETDIICKTATLCIALGLFVAGTSTAQKLSRVRITSTTVGVAVNLRSSSRLPTVFSPRPDGSGCIGYTDTKGDARVFAVNRKFQRTSVETIIKGHRLVGLHANPDGSFALLASTEEGPTEFRPGWCSGDNTLWAIKVGADGKTLWKTHLIGGKGYGPQQKWFINGSAAVLAHNGSVYGAFYSVGRNFAKPGKAPNSHEGDAFKAFEEQGDIRDDLSCFWNCSHSKDQRMLVDGEDFLTLTMGDTYPLGVLFKAHPSRRRGVVWPEKSRGAELKKNYKLVFMPGGLGGIAFMGDGLAATATTFIRDGEQKSINSAERFVLFLRFDKGGALVAKRYLTAEPEMRGLRAYVGNFGRLALVGWGIPGRKETTLAVMNDDGSYALSPWRSKHSLSHRAGFVSMPNGDLVWAYARNGSRKVEMKRAVLPKSLRRGTRSTPKSPIAKKAPAARKVAPRPKGKVEEVLTHYTTGSVRTRYSIDAAQLRTGWSTRYYRSGQIKARAKYAGGVKWGRSEEFYADGKIRYSSTFVDGLEHGERVEYDADGKVTLRQVYREGEPTKE
jgi:hypothetical protein